MINEALIFGWAAFALAAAPPAAWFAHLYEGGRLRAERVLDFNPDALWATLAAWGGAAFLWAVRAQLMASAAAQ